ncbi:MAG: NADH-quinone oxidoreductase subunit I [Coriobacteriia bacterium]|nr:NADH-quinone oxidoreductase subunit I [Coriobacteriia bacterium]
MLGIAKGLATVFGRMVKPSVTEQYPIEKRTLPERARMSFGMTRDESGSAKCKASMLCERSCPDEAIVIESEKRADGPGRVLTKFSIDLGRCMYCGLCVEQCTSDGLHHTGDYENNSTKREDMILVLFDASLEPAAPSPMDESTPEQLAEVTETFGAIPVAKDGGAE